MLTTENTLLLVIDCQEKMMPAMRGYEELEKKTGILVRGCRVLGVPILATQQYTKGLGDTLPSIKDAIGEFEPIEKMTFSCCGSDEFVNKLKETGMKNVLVTGVEAHICVQLTVMDLLENGYVAYVMADCIGSRSERDFAYAVERMRQAGAVITTTESVLFEFLKRADHPKRKEITSLVK